jgi:hypothetical protein
MMPAVTDNKIRVLLAGIPAGRRLLAGLERLRRRDAEHIAGERILYERIESLERRVEQLRRGCSPQREAGGDR